MRHADSRESLARGLVCLRDRAEERQVSQEELLALAEWKAEDPDVPSGDWYKRGQIPEWVPVAGAGRPREALRSIIVDWTSDQIGRALRRSVAD